MQKAMKLDCHLLNHNHFNYEVLLVNKKVVSSIFYFEVEDANLSGTAFLALALVDIIADFSDSHPNSSLKISLAHLALSSKASERDKYTSSRKCVSITMSKPILLHVQSRSTRNIHGLLSSK